MQKAHNHIKHYIKESHGLVRPQEFLTRDERGGNQQIHSWRSPLDLLSYRACPIETEQLGLPRWLLFYPLLDPFSPLHIQCTAWILSGWSSLHDPPIPLGLMWSGTMSL